MKISQDKTLKWATYSFWLIAYLTLTVNSNLPYVTALFWFLSLMTLQIYYKYAKENILPIENSSIIYIKLYIIWNIISSLRGFFLSENYWDYKYSILNGLSLVLPIISICCIKPIFIKTVLNFYIYRILLFVPLIALLLGKIIFTNALPQYLIPLTFIILLLPAVKIRWSILIFFILLVTFLLDPGSRSNFIRFGISIILAIFIYIAIYLKFKESTVKLISVALGSIMLFAPIVFFILATTLDFNVFKISEYSGNESTFVQLEADGTKTQRDIGTDTRTFLYEEVLNSAINNNYIIFGRTPSRGNDSNIFINEAEGMREERISNEAGILNVFTWTGIIGVVLYFLIFIRSFLLSVFHSNNIYSKVIGVFTVFQWAHSWVENIQLFSFMYINIWLLVGFSCSLSFRKMNNSQMTLWIQDLFSKKIIIK